VLREVEGRREGTKGGRRERGVKVIPLCLPRASLIWMLVSIMFFRPFLRMDKRLASQRAFLSEQRLFVES
jgi:hypothetical protein